ncbi:hypothetical protein HDU93_008671, partial [Gonapodya sp. JEL0774]
MGDSFYAISISSGSSSPRSDTAPDSEFLRANIKDEYHDRYMELRKGSSTRGFLDDDWIEVKDGSSVEMEEDRNRTPSPPRRPRLPIPKMRLLEDDDNDDVTEGVWTTVQQGRGFKPPRSLSPEVIDPLEFLKQRGSFAPLAGKTFEVEDSEDEDNFFDRSKSTSKQLLTGAKKRDISQVVTPEKKQGLSPMKAASLLPSTSYSPPKKAQRIAAGQLNPPRAHIQPGTPAHAPPYPSRRSFAQAVSIHKPAKLPSSAHLYSNAGSRSYRIPGPISDSSSLGSSDDDSNKDQNTSSNITKTASALFAVPGEDPPLDFSVETKPLSSNPLFRSHVSHQMKDRFSNQQIARILFNIKSGVASFDGLGLSKDIAIAEQLTDFRTVGGHIDPSSWITLTKVVRAMSKEARDFPSRKHLQRLTRKDLANFDQGSWTTHTANASSASVSLTTTTNNRRLTTTRVTIQTDYRTLLVDGEQVVRKRLCRLSQGDEIPADKAWLIEYQIKGRYHGEWLSNIIPKKPHGNRIPGRPGSTVPHRKTNPATIAKATELLNQGYTPSQVTRKVNAAVHTSSPHFSLPDTLRDMKQTRNLKWTIKNNSHLLLQGNGPSHDEIQEFVQLAMLQTNIGKENPGAQYLHNLELASLSALLGRSGLFEHAADVGSHNRPEELSDIPLAPHALDTTFKLIEERVDAHATHQYLHWNGTVLSVRDDSMARPSQTGRSPWMIVAIFLHYTRDTPTYKRLLSNLVELCPRLRYMAYLITDDAPEFNSLPLSIFPMVKPLLCWRHSIENLESWCRKAGYTNAEVTALQKTIFGEVYGQCATGPLYQGGIADLDESELQAPDFLESIRWRFKKTIGPKMDRFASCRRSEAGFPKGEAVYTNGAESMNKVLLNAIAKDPSQRKISAACTAMKELFRTTLFEIKKAYDNEAGEYAVSDAYGPFLDTLRGGNSHQHVEREDITAAFAFAERSMEEGPVLPFSVAELTAKLYKENMREVMTDAVSEALTKARYLQGHVAAFRATPKSLYLYVVPNAILNRATGLAGNKAINESFCIVYGIPEDIANGTRQRGPRGKEPLIKCLCGGKACAEWIRNGGFCSHEAAASAHRGAHVFKETIETISYTTQRHTTKAVALAFVHRGAGEKGERGARVKKAQPYSCKDQIAWQLKPVTPNIGGNSEANQETESRSSATTHSTTL